MSEEEPIQLVLFENDPIAVRYMAAGDSKKIILSKMMRARFMIDFPGTLACITDDEITRWGSRFIAQYGCNFTGTDESAWFEKQVMNFCGARLSGTRAEARLADKRERQKKIKIPRLTTQTEWNDFFKPAQLPVDTDTQKAFGQVERAVRRDVQIIVANDNPGLARLMEAENPLFEKYYRNLFADESARLRSVIKSCCSITIAQNRVGVLMRKRPGMEM